MCEWCVCVSASGGGGRVCVCSPLLPPVSAVFMVRPSALCHIQRYDYNMASEQVSRAILTSRNWNGKVGHVTDFRKMNRRLFSLCGLVCVCVHVHVCVPHLKIFGPNTMPSAMGLILLCCSWLETTTRKQHRCLRRARCEGGRRAIRAFSRRTHSAGSLLNSAGQQRDVEVVHAHMHTHTQTHSHMHSLHAHSRTPHTPRKRF